MNLFQFLSYKFYIFLFLFATQVLAVENTYLSETEKLWIKNNPKVILGADHNWPPYDFLTDQGVHSGIASDYLKLLSQKSGLSFEVRAGIWSNILEQMRNSKLDGLTCAAKTPQREKFLTFSSPYVSMPLAIIVRDERFDISTIEDLKGLNVVVNKDSYLHEWLVANHPELNLILTTSNVKSLEAVSFNKADAYIGNIAVAMYIIRENFLTNLKIVNKLNDITTDVSIAIDKKKKTLASIVEKSLAQITSQEHKMIKEKWFKNSMKNKISSINIALSEEEKKWIKTHPTVKYSEINWEPMSIIEKNTMTGIMNEYLKVITEKTGLSFKYVPSSSWPEVIEKFKNKEIDIVPGIGESDYETQLGLTSDVYANFPFVLITKINHSYIENISELEGQTIAVPKYWTSYNYLKEQQPNIKILETNNLFEALNSVRDGKADAFMGHMAIGMHYVGTYYAKTLHIAGKVEYNFNHKILLQKENKRLLNIINKVFKSMSEEEHLKIKNKWLQVKVNEAKDYTLFYQLGTVLFMLIIGTIYWNRKLSKEILVRMEIEKALEIEKDNFKLLFEKVSDGNLIIQDEKFVTCNDAAIKMLGLHDKSEILESSPLRWSPFIQPDGSSSEEKNSLMMQYCLENGSNRFEWLYVDKENKEFWVDVGLTKISYEGKEAIYVVWRDITKQKFLEQNLKDNDLQMRTLIDNIPLHVIVSSYEGKVYLANKQTLIDYEVKGVDLDTLNVAEYYANPKDREDVINELKNKGFVDKKMVQFRRPSGVYSMMFSVLPIKYANEDMILSISVDMTERLKMEKSLSEAKNIAEQANKSKSEFLANMSHEIRTPMNAIIGFTELLEEQLSEPRLKSYVKTIQTASATLLTLINDILDLSKIEAGKLQINKTPTDLKKLCEEIASIFTMNIKSKGLDIIVDVDSNIPQSLLIDEIRLRQILLNLIGNSVKFTDHGYIKLSVNAQNIDEHLSKLDLEIIVEDTGVGIASSQLKKIFQEFEQNEGQDNRKFGGTGLGLSISQRLSKMMNGDISVESEEGKGSKFVVNLSKIDISSVVSEKRLNKKLSKDVRNIVFKEAKILIVDDVKDNRELIVKNFEGTNIHVVTANNGLEAIENFKVENPNLILMDIRMPVLDGYEAAMEIKKISQVPIVALTASVMQDEYEKSKRENFDGFLRKPVLRHELFTELGKFLDYDEVKLETKNKKENLIPSAKAKANIANILQILSTEIKKIQLQALHTNNISDMKKLASAVRSLAIEFDVEVLDIYASKLYEAIDAFDIPVIEELLNNFDDLVNKLSST